MNCVGDIANRLAATRGPPRRVPAGIFMPFPGHRTIKDVDRENKTSWEVLNLLGSRNEIHVIPMNDLRDHEETAECWCGPQAHQGNPNGVIICHNSLDGREKAEIISKLRQTDARPADPSP